MEHLVTGHSVWLHHKYGTPSPHQSGKLLQLLILNINLSLITLNWHIFSLELIYSVLLFFYIYIFVSLVLISRIF